MPEQNTSNLTLEQMASGYTGLVGSFKKRNEDKNSFYDYMSKSSGISKDELIEKGDVRIEGLANSGIGEYQTRLVDYTQKNLDEVLGKNPADYLLNYMIGNMKPSEENAKKNKEIAEVHKKVYKMNETLKEGKDGKNPKKFKEMHDYVLTNVITDIFKKGFVENYVRSDPSIISRIYASEVEKEKAKMAEYFISWEDLNKGAITQYLKDAISEENKGNLFLNTALNAGTKKE
jgi:hypothetical protein